MSEDKARLPAATPSEERWGTEIIERLVSVARPESAFSAPISAGEYTVITAAESFAAVGFGFGSGRGRAQSNPEDVLDVNEGGGVGLGGGGTAWSRPVAVICVGPSGVEVKPLVDETKLKLTAVTALGGVGAALLKMWRWR